jgi:hypothetical protein
MQDASSGCGRDDKKKKNVRLVSLFVFEVPLVRLCPVPLFFYFLPSPFLFSRHCE